MLTIKFLVITSFILGCKVAEAIVVMPTIEKDYTHIVWYPNQRASPTSAEKPSQEEQLLLQIYLDELNYGPGVLDGALGRFSKEALKAYYRTIGEPEDSSLALGLKHAFRHKNLPYVTAEVPSLAKRFINHKLPWKYSELAEHNKALYRSYAEFMAERYHTSTKVLTRLNGKSKINNLTTGKALVVPNVRPFQIEDVENRRYNQEETIMNNFAVIDTKKNVMHIFKRENPDHDSASATLIAFFPITPGRADQIKYGEWEVRNCITFPTWRYDPKVLKGTGRSSDKDAIDVPPGPNNPVGIIWNGLSARSVGIHGTNDPDTIGRAKSSGCIRMSNWDVVKIPNFLRPGCKVTIQ